jgi:hypothetical protein
MAKTTAKCILGLEEVFFSNVALQQTKTINNTTEF